MALGNRSAFARGARKIDPNDVALLAAAQGGVDSSELGDESVTNRVLLGQGMAAHQLGGATVNSPFRRSVVNRGGRLMEAHDYGGGNVKYFARKNPAILQAASEAALAQQTGGTSPAAPQGLSPRDAELLRMLLGNQTLRR